MRTSYKAQICRSEKSFKIQFETSNYDLFKKVERACRIAADFEDKEIEKMLGTI